MRDVRVSTDANDFQHTIRIGSHTFLSDAGKDSGGLDMGPDPHEILLASLGACTAITLKMYAKTKQMPLAGVDVHVTAEKTDASYKMIVKVELKGQLSLEQRERLLEISKRCPVHKTLLGKLEIENSLL